MNDNSGRQEGGDRPDILRNYRPLGIRSVIAACAMIPRAQKEALAEPSSSATAFVLPDGFHNPVED